MPSPTKSIPELSIQPKVSKKRRTLLQVVMGKPKQTGIEVVWPWDEKGKKKWKRARRTARIGGGLFGPLFAAGWRYRLALAPWALALVSFGIASRIHTVGHPLAAGLIALIAYAVLAAAVTDRAEGDRQTLIAGIGTMAAGTWVLLVAVAGLDWRPVRIYAVAVFVVLAIPWWNHHRFGGVMKAAVTAGSLALTWQLRVARKVAPGTEIIHEEPLIIAGKQVGDRGLIEVTGEDADLTTSDLIKLTEKITGRLKMPIGQVAIDVPEDGRADRAMCLRFPVNPLRHPIKFGASDFSLTTGMSTVGQYIDGSLTNYVWAVPNYGAVHDLVAGATGAGKSSYCSELLATSRAAGTVLCHGVETPVIVDWVIDPQEGQSAPDWMDNVDRSARSAVEGLILLEQARRLMYWRNHYLANYRWTDGKGRERKGYAFFPWMTIGMPLLVITIFEAHAVLALPGAREVLEDLVKMARKCGIKIRLEVQVPLLDQLGNSTVIRDQVASGNVTVFRTANRLSGQVAFNGNLPVDPAAIPKYFPGKEPAEERITAGLGYMLGADASAMMFRAFVEEDALDHATAGETHHLAVAESEAAGIWPPTPEDVVHAAELIVAAAAGEDPGAETPAQAATTKELITGWMAEHGPDFRNEIVGALVRDPNGPKDQPGKKSNSSLHAAITALVKDSALVETEDGRLQLRTGE